MRNLKTIAIVLGIYAAAIVMEVAIAFSSSEYEGGIGALLILVLLCLNSNLWNILHIPGC